jgi:hypothetical protein
LCDERKRRGDHHGAAVAHALGQRRRRYVTQDLADAEQGEGEAGRLRRRAEV